MRYRDHLQDQCFLLHHQKGGPITFLSIHTGRRTVTDALEAVLKRKLPREIKNREDALTSMIFGAFRREPTGKRILEFLNKAECILGAKPDLAKCCQVNYGNYREILQEKIIEPLLKGRFGGRGE